MAESTGGTVKAEDIQLNYDYKLQIIVPNTEDVGGTPQTIARGFDNITEAINEVLYQTSFLSDKGWGSSYVTGGQLIFTLTGVRVLGDAAQDYIFSDKVYMASAPQETFSFCCRYQSLPPDSRLFLRATLLLLKLRAPAALPINPALYRSKYT